MNQAQINIINCLTKNYFKSREAIERLDDAIQSYHHAYFLVLPHRNMEDKNFASVYFSDQGDLSLDELIAKQATCFSTTVNSSDIELHSFSTCACRDIPKLELSQTDIIKIRDIKEKHTSALSQSEEKAVFEDLSAKILNLDGCIINTSDFQDVYAIRQFNSNNKIFGLFSKKSGYFVAIFKGQHLGFGEYDISSVHFSFTGDQNDFKEYVSSKIDIDRPYISSDFLAYFGMTDEIFSD